MSVTDNLFVIIFNNSLQRHTEIGDYRLSRAYELGLLIMFSERNNIIVKMM